MNCYLCKNPIHEKEIEKYTLSLDVELKGGAKADMEVAIDCSETPLCLACAVNLARQGLNKLCSTE